MMSRLRWIMLVVVSILVIGIACTLGFWWITFLVGIGIKLLEPRRWRAVSIVCIGSILGWGLPLVYFVFRFPIMGVAWVVSTFIGIAPDISWLVIAVTLFLGLLLGLSGFWLSYSIINLVVYVNNVRE